MGADELRRGRRGAAVRGLRRHRGADVGGGERVRKAALTRFRPLLAPAAWPEGGDDRLGPSAAALDSRRRGTGTVQLMGPFKTCGL
jgi:hypothetical protein